MRELLRAKSHAAVTAKGYAWLNKPSTASTLSAHPGASDARMGITTIVF